MIIKTSLSTALQYVSELKVQNPKLIPRLCTISTTEENRPEIKEAAILALGKLSDNANDALFLVEVFESEIDTAKI